MGQKALKIDQSYPKKFFFLRFQVKIDPSGDCVFLTRHMRV